MATDSTDVGSTPVLAAYAAVHGEVDALIKAAERKASEMSALMTMDSTAIRPNTERFPLSKRDIAVIAGQVWLFIRDLVANQQLASVETTKAVMSLAHKTQTKGVSETSLADFAVLARPTLDELGIDPTPADMHAIGKTLLGYFSLIKADIKKLQRMDFSPPKLAEFDRHCPRTSLHGGICSWHGSNQQQACWNKTDMASVRNDSVHIRLRLVNSRRTSRPIHQMS